MQRKTSFLIAIALCLFAAVPDALAAIDLADQRVAPEHEPAAEHHRPHGLIAPRTACPDQGSADAPINVQRRAMRCMTEYARQSRDLAALGEARKLDRSASEKAADILRCDSFSHFACGRDFTYWMARSGYLSARCWRVGENLAWGIGDSTVRSIFRTWIHSPEHRHNILAKGFRQIGISVRIGDLAGRNHSSIWTQHFGSHC